MREEALTAMHERGYRTTTVPVARLDELREHYEGLFRRRELKTDLAQDLMKGLTFRPPDTVPNPSSLILVATRDPIVRCTFRWRGTDISIPVPPTYLKYRSKNDEVVRMLAELLPEQCHLALLPNAPEKLLAVRSGLARYGRNNISYISGFGSFFRLTMVCTDLECDGGEWSEPSMMETCDGCAICASVCPTEAIPEDRFLLRAELCITYWNEKPGDIPFPEWMEANWHNCLVGCMHCQQACPENEGMVDYEEIGPSFTEDETEALLLGSGANDLPKGLKEKLESWDLLVWLEELPRNLAVHLPGVDNQPPR